MVVKIAKTERINKGRLGLFALAKKTRGSDGIDKRNFRNDTFNEPKGLKKRRGSLSKNAEENQVKKRTDYG